MRIAIIGCGQLARMLALEGWRMGLRFSFLAEPNENTDCVNGLGQIIRLNDRLCGEALFNALGKPDVVTVEREHVDTNLLKLLMSFCKLYPSVNGIEISQHRGREKDFLNQLGVSTAPYELAHSEGMLRAAVNHLGFPVLIKTCDEGYDGKGQWKIESSLQLSTFVVEVGFEKQLVVEKLIEFEKEVSMISARSPSGDCVFYPVTENIHRDGILLSSIAPAELSFPALSQQAIETAQCVLSALDYVGVLAIEFFVLRDRLLVNELAPRVHNSGHWTQVGGLCSQFENHLRSITGVTLGTTTTEASVGMINILGQKVDESLALVDNMQVHDYNKACYPNRKMGHVNILSTDRLQLLA